MSSYDDKKPLIDMSLDELSRVNNIAELLEPDVLTKIGATVVKDYETDELSRKDWLEKKYKPALEQATQVAKQRTFPWPNASNVKYPLLLNAGLQFHARAYPALVPGDGIVTGKVIGGDEDGSKREKAERIGAHMSYQLFEQMEGWEAGMDSMLITLPFTGTEFKKTYYDPELGYNVSTHIFAKDLVVNYHAKTLNLAPRITEIMTYTQNELTERYRSGEFLEVKDVEPVVRSDASTEVKDASKGMSAPPVTDDDTPFEVLEQHRYYDMDGDGYKEPYICTVLKDSGKVLRIVAAYYPEGVHIEGGVVKYVTRINYYTAYNFIPNPAGGIYGIGFGDLLGPLNRSVDTLINQIIDKGTISNLGGGFISRNLRIAGGEYRFKPGQWMNVNASGMDLRNGIMPLPFGEPSGTLFSLLTFLVNAGERVSATTDMQVGENPGQNQKAETTRTVQENGMKVFTAIYKRIRKALEEELYKLFLLNKRYVDTKEYFTVVAPNGRDMQTLDISYTDYQTADVSVVPSADPHLASPEQKMGRAQYLAGMLQLGGFNEYEVKKRMLEAGNIERIEEVLPDPKGENAIEPPPNPDLLKIQLEMQKEQNAEKERAFRREFDMQELRVRAIEAQAKHAIAQQNANTQATKTHGDIAHKTAELALNHMNSQEEATPSAATQ